MPAKSSSSSTDPRPHFGPRLATIGGKIILWSIGVIAVISLVYWIVRMTVTGVALGLTNFFLGLVGLVAAFVAIVGLIALLAGLIVVWIHRATAQPKAGAPAPILDIAGMVAVPVVIGFDIWRGLADSASKLNPVLTLAIFLVSFAVFFVAAGSREAAARKMPMAVGFWPRFWAGVIDGILLTLIPGLVSVVAGSDFAAFRDGGGAALFHLGIGVLSWIYFAGLESSPIRASVGKLALGLRVVGEDGGRISFLQASFRNLANLVSVGSMGFGIFFSFWHPKKAMVHDLMSRSTVVRAEDSAAK